MFFDEYPRFIQTSETTHNAKLLNARYEGLIMANADIIRGATVLDLASHDGRWSFAALKNGASFVYGIEWKPRLVRKSNENFAASDIRSLSHGGSQTISTHASATPGTLFTL